MKVINHRLCGDDDTPYPFVMSPNFSEGVELEYLVIHYTAGRNAESSVRSLTNPKSKASAHLVIGKDGSITQLVPFNVKAWHAGQSTWEERRGLNRYSIGIELDNAGRLQRHGNRWRAWFGEEYDDEDVIEAVHKNESSSSGWQVYTPEQIEVGVEVAELLVAHYNLRDVLGHDDIAPKRKQDPGPAFPMESFRSRVLGRLEDEQEQHIEHITSSTLNIRRGPGTQHKPILGSPLPIGTRVEILAREGRWAQVEVLDVVKGIMDMEGWVHTRYLKRIIASSSLASRSP